MKKLNCKEILELIAISYEDNRSHEFDKQLIAFVDKKEYANEAITEDDIKGLLDNFTFPSKFEWCMNEYDKYLGTYENEK